MNVRKRHHAPPVNRRHTQHEYAYIVFRIVMQVPSSLDSLTVFVCIYILLFLSLSLLFNIKTAYSIYKPALCTKRTIGENLGISRSRKTEFAPSRGYKFNAIL